MLVNWYVNSLKCKFSDCTLEDVIKFYDTWAYTYQRMFIYNKQLFKQAQTYRIYNDDYKLVKILEYKDESKLKANKYF